MEPGGGISCLVADDEHVGIVPGTRSRNRGEAGGAEGGKSPVLQDGGQAGPAVLDVHVVPPQIAVFLQSFVRHLPPAPPASPHPEAASGGMARLHLESGMVSHLSWISNGEYSQMAG